jgi:hypothetical protein
MTSNIMMKSIIFIFSIFFSFLDGYAQSKIFSGLVSTSIQRKNEYVIEVSLVSSDTLPSSANLELASQSLTPLKSLITKKTSQSLTDSGGLWQTIYKTSFNLAAVPFLGDMPYLLGFRFSEPNLKDFFAEATFYSSPISGSYNPLKIKPLLTVGTRKAQELADLNWLEASSDSLTFQLVKPKLSFKQINEAYFFPDDRKFCSDCSFRINTLTGRFEIKGTFRPGIYEIYVKVNRWSRSMGPKPLYLGNSVVKLTYTFL